MRGGEQWPSRLEFEAADRKALRDAVRRLGGPERWAAEFGLPLQNLKFGSKRAWTDERIEAELRKLLAGRATWPTPREFELSGSFGLAAAVFHRRGTVYWARFFGSNRHRAREYPGRGFGLTSASAPSSTSSVKAAPHGRPSASSSTRESPRSTALPAATGGRATGPTSWASPQAETRTRAGLPRR